MAKLGRECEDLLSSLALWLQDEVRWSGALSEILSSQPHRGGEQKSYLHEGFTRRRDSDNYSDKHANLREIFTVIFSKLILKTRHHTVHHGTPQCTRVDSEIYCIQLLPESLTSSMI